MVFLKPNVNIIWADEGQLLPPSPAKIAQGWVSEIPDYEFENWLQNKQDQFNAHINQHGIPVWDSETEYQAGKSYVQASDGNIYKALTENINKDPLVNPTDWVKAFREYEDSFSKQETLDQFQQSVNIVGMVASFATPSAPTGWLVCDGSAVSRTTYSTLFSRLGTLYGAGDGSSTFNLPDLRNEFVRGSSPTRSVGSKQADSLRSHEHTGTTDVSGSHTHPLPADVSGEVVDRYGTVLVGQGDSTTPGVEASGEHSHTFTTDSTGGSETRPRNIALLYCIKY